MAVQQYNDDRISMLCIGGANIDYCGVPNTGLTIGQSARGTITRSFGGVALNVAKGIRAITNAIADGAVHPLATERNRAALAGRAVDIALWSVVGNDSAGNDILAYLTDANIDGSQVLVSDEHPTGRYICIQNERGATHLAVSDIHAVESLTIEQARALLAQPVPYDAVFVDCNLLEPILHAIVPQMAGATANAKIFCDPVSPQKSQRIRGVLRHLYYVAPNVDEAYRITGTNTPQDAIEHLLAAGVTVPIITAGADGVWYADNGTVKRYAIEPLALQSDCGLGDWFNAAMMVGEILNMPIEQCIDFAHRVVVHTITKDIRAPLATATVTTARGR